MEILLVLKLILAVVCAQPIFASNSPNFTSTLPEQLFLDLRIHDALTNASGARFVEPWSSMYIRYLQEHRLGDAIWARYHIFGNVEDGMIKGSANLTVLESIEEDARDYRASDPEIYTEAVSFYNRTSIDDTHASDVLQMIKRIGQENIIELSERDKTYGIKCSSHEEAYEANCATLLARMSQSKTYVGDERIIASYGNCHLRVGPYKGTSTDMTWWTVHAVGKLIIQECEKVPACYTYKVVSGFSPQNDGHRKICLSKKDSGCSGTTRR